MEPIFQGREEAGRALGLRLRELLTPEEAPLVLALPRGGVPVAEEVAQALDAPLDVILVRKLGLPQEPELAMGAIASGGILVRNPELDAILHLSEEQIRQVAHREARELARREENYRGMRPRPPLAGRTVILVDDGLATGSSMRAAVTAIRSQHPGKVVVAVPVAPPDTVAILAEQVDEVVCLETPEPFYSVGACYETFPQVPDAAVRKILERAWTSAGPSPGASGHQSPGP